MATPEQAPPGATTTTTLPLIAVKVEKVPKKVEVPLKSVTAIRRDIQWRVEDQLVEARIPGSWAYQQMMNNLRVHEAATKEAMAAQSKGQSFVQDNVLQAAGRHTPQVRYELLLKKGAREAAQATDVVERRNARVSEESLHRNVTSSLHREVALERNRALRRWVLEVASASSSSLQMRWLVHTALASRTNALGARLAARRRAAAAHKVFLGVIKLVVMLNRISRKAQVTVASARLVDFLTQLRTNGRWNKWILCFERVKRCAVRCQRRFRDKRACRVAQRALLAQQWRRATRCPSGTRLPRSVEAAIAAWHWSRVREWYVTSKQWEAFELWPLLRQTVDERKGLIFLDLKDPSSWPATFKIKVDPLKAFLAARRAEAEAKLRGPPSTPVLNTHDQADRARRRWRVAFRAVDAARAFACAGDYCPARCGAGDLSPAADDLCMRVAALSRVKQFVEKHGDLGRIPPAPALQRTMDVNQARDFAARHPRPGP